MLKNNLQSTVQSIKKLPAMQETWVQFPGWENPLEKGMATHSGILAWRIPWTEETGGLQSMGSQEWDTTQQLNNNNKALGVYIFHPLVCHLPFGGKWRFFTGHYIII